MLLAFSLRNNLGRIPVLAINSVFLSKGNLFHVAMYEFSISAEF
jgi:hypothetical protein